MMTLKGKYTEANIYAEEIEESAIQQVYDIINCKAFDGCKVICMPDVHTGKMGPCGLVAEIKDYVCPSHVGVDISCSVSMVKYKGQLRKEDYAVIEHKIKNAVPMGNNVHQKCVIDEKAFRKFLSNEFQKAKQQYPIVLQNLPDTVTEKWISDVCNRIGMDEGKFWKSIGTVGGGNHYEEINVDDEGNYALSLHFGSRNFGLKVANYWTKIADNHELSSKDKKVIINTFKKNYQDSHLINGKPDMSNFKADLQRFLDVQTEDEIKGYLREDDKDAYLCDMVFAQAYARYNHYTVQDIINKILEKFGLKPIEQIMTTHNYIDFRTMTLRKSAISAHAGEKILIPFNMRDGIAECTGLGNSDWLDSAPHGAGRKMSRSKAKQEITLEKMQKDMEGIYTTSVCPGTIDEAPDAYKDTESIKRQIDGITVRIDKMWKPVINIKSAN